MAIAKVASVSAKSTTGNNVTTASIDTTGTSLLIAAVASYEPNTHTVSDSASNTWGSSIPAYNDGLGEIRLYFVASPTTSGTHTFTVSSTSDFPAVAVIALSGTHTSPYDSTQNGSGSSATTRQPGSITPSQDNCVAISALVMSEASAGTITISGGGFSVVDEQTVFTSGQAFGVALAFVVQTTASATNPTWAWNGTAKSTAAVIAAFRAAAGGGSPTLTPDQSIASLAGQDVRMGFAILMPDEP